MIRLNFGCMSRRDRATGSLLRSKDDTQPEAIQHVLREFPFCPFSRITIRQRAYMYQTENMVLIKNMSHLPWMVGKTRKGKFHNYDPLSAEILKILIEKKAEPGALGCFSVNVFLHCDKQSKWTCPGYALTRNLYRFSDRNIRNRIEPEDLKDDDLVRSLEAADLYALRRVCKSLDSIPCLRCGVGADLDADKENTITCKGCASKAHLGCISLGKSRRESWYCPVCRVIAPALTGSNSTFSVEVASFELEQEPVNDLVLADHNDSLSYEVETAIIVEDGLTPESSPERRSLEDESAGSCTTEGPRRRRKRKQQRDSENDQMRTTTECSSSPKLKERHRLMSSDIPTPHVRVAGRASSKSSSTVRRLTSRAADISSSKSAEVNLTMNSESTSCSASSLAVTSHHIVDPLAQLSQQPTRKRVRRHDNNHSSHVRLDVESDPATSSRMVSDNDLYDCEGPLFPLDESHKCGVPRSSSSSSSAKSTTGSYDDAGRALRSLQFPELTGVEHWIDEEYIKQSCVALEALITTEFLREDIHDEQHLQEEIISAVRRFQWDKLQAIHCVILV